MAWLPAFISLYRGLCIWKGSDLASWGGHSALKSGSLGMNHRRAPLVSRSFLFQPVGCKDVKSPGLLCCTGCYWLLLLKKKQKKQNKAKWQFAKEAFVWWEKCFYLRQERRQQWQEAALGSLLMEPSGGSSL